MRADSAALGAAADLLREQGHEKLAITAEVLRNFVDMAEATLSPLKSAEGFWAMVLRVPNVYNTLREAEYSVAGSVALTGMTLAADVTGVTSLEEAWTRTRILTPDVPMSMADRITSGIMGSLQLAATGAGIYAGAGAAGGWIRGSGVGKLSTKGLAANLGDLADMQGGTVARASAGPGRPGMGVVANNGGLSPRTPVGRSGQQHHWPNPNAPAPRNSPTTINGRDYSGHAIDRMQERGYVPSVVENAIKTGTPKAGKSRGTTVFTDTVNQLRVVVNSRTGRVVTIIPGVG